MPGCRNRRDTPVGKTLSFHTIPAHITWQGEQTEKLSLLRRKRWLRILGLRQVDLTPRHVVCSAHFRYGKPSPLYNTDNPDWVPNVFGSKAVENAQQQSTSDDFKKGWRGYVLEWGSNF